jgi:hypothetical protein
MTATREHPKSDPTAVAAQDETDPTAAPDRRWYEARPGARGTFTFQGKSYPWWVVILAVVVFIV